VPILAAGTRAVQGIVAVTGVARVGSAPARSHLQRLARAREPDEAAPVGGRLGIGCRARAPHGTPVQLTLRGSAAIARARIPKDRGEGDFFVGHEFSEGQGSVSEEHDAFLPQAPATVIRI